MAKRPVIVELRAQAQDKSEGAFRGSIDLDIPSFELDRTYGPVPTQSTDPQRQGEQEDAILIRGEIDELFLGVLESHPQVIGVWDDGPIEPFTSSTGVYPEPVDCDSETAKGDLAQVTKYLGCDAVWERGHRGQGITVAICDTGINSSDTLVVKDGWSPIEAIPYGRDLDGHGSMCATDLHAVAPGAELLDVGLLKGTSFISDALAAYEWIIDKYKRTGTPQVVSNSWGVSRGGGGASSYAEGPDHKLNRRIVDAINLGICVVFAAGNCGSGGCANHIRCGQDIGEGRSIWGANGHERVITVGAANIHGAWIGYSSQGPAALYERKPDLCAPSHYKGYNPVDAGTSAACPLCAGVVALLRQACPTLDVKTIQRILQESATPLGSGEWNYSTGFGMLNAKAAFDIAVQY